MRLPDGPRSFSYLYLLRWIVRPLELLEDCAQRYGDPFALGLVGPFRPTVFFSSPHAIQQIFTLSTEQVEVGISSNRPLLPILGENSLLFLDGYRHQRQRRLLMPPFHGERMRAYAQLIVSITQQAIARWQIGQPFSVRSSTQEISLRVILHAVFGLTKGHRYQQLFEKLSALLHTIGSPVNTSMLFVRLF